jgi:hypothetical protein
MRLNDQCNPLPSKRLFVHSNFIFRGSHMLKSDVQYRKWRNPKAERQAIADQRKEQAQYDARCAKLAAFITEAVRHTRISNRLKADSQWSFLLLLKEQIDQTAGGCMIRQPWLDRPSTEGDRQQFMRKAFELALEGDLLVRFHSDRSIFWLYVKPKTAKWFMHRDGQAIADYIPSNEELTVPDQGFASAPEFAFTDQHRHLMRGWGESADMIA